MVRAVKTVVAITLAVGVTEQPALGGERSAMAAAFKTVCIDNAQSVAAAAGAWSGLTGKRISDMVFGARSGHYSGYSPLDRISGAGKERFTLSMRAPTESEPLTHCTIVNSTTRTPQEHLDALTALLSLSPVPQAGARQLSEAEVMLGVDARSGEEFWASPLVPGAQIKSDVTLPNAEPEPGTNPLFQTSPSPFGDVYFSIDYNPQPIS